MASYSPITNTLNFAVSLKPTTAFPLDARSMFGSYQEAAAAAATAEMPGSSNTIYYIGQTLTVIENDIVGYYQIMADKTLKVVGAMPVGDDKTITVQDNVIGLKGFGVEYYKYFAPEGDVAQHYELTQGWKSGLEPKVVDNGDGTFSLAWYEPSTTTVEGLNSTVASMQTQVEQNAETLATLNGDADVEGSIKNQVAAAVASLLENSDEEINSIKELVDWFTEHETDAVQMSKDITANATAIKALEDLIGAPLPEGIQATTVIGYITEAYNLANGAVKSVTAGTENGHLNVDGTDVKVYELPKASVTDLGGVKVDGTSITTNEEGVASVSAVDHTKVTGLATQLEAATNSAVEQANEYADGKFIPSENITDSTSVPETAEAASDAKVISEKVFMDALTWKDTM